MQNFRRRYSRLQDLLLREEGQDLIEYVMVFSLIALAATAGMQSAASGVNTVFTTVGSILTAATS
jgi:pilus assembly protein Flp/PilA